jgi:hypothetical protein
MARFMAKSDWLAKARSTSKVPVSVKDETYIIDLCDRVLGQKASRQHRFPFLVGDRGTMLPVDAYYADLNLVVEYHERQHDEAIKFFDKPGKLTCSGVPRSEQRNLYDRRRHEFLRSNAIRLIELKVGLFQHNSQKRLKQNLSDDERVVRHELAGIIPTPSGVHSQ